MVELKRPESLKRVKTRRVYVPLDDTTFDQLVQMAWRNQVSISFAGQIAIMKLITAEAKGEFSFVPGYHDGQPIPRA